MRDRYEITIHDSVLGEVKNILNAKLVNMYCKHVLSQSSDTLNTTENKLYVESKKLGYDVVLWGTHLGHAGDIKYHIDKILQMETDQYNHAIRVVICKYDFCDTPIIWADNLHSTIKYIREYGKGVRLKDVPFYVVDISNYNYPSVYGHKGSLRKNNEDILGAVACAYKRFRRSNSPNLIELGYTIDDFLADHPELYFAFNTHLDKISFY